MNESKLKRIINESTDNDIKELCGIDLITKDIQDLLDSGKYALEEDIFDYVSSPDRFGLTRVRLDEKCNLINQNGKIISDTWFDYVFSTSLNTGLVKVERNGFTNLLKTDGSLVSDIWFDQIRNEYYGLSLKLLKVYREGKYNFIGKDGKLVSKVWFDEIDDNYGVRFMQQRGRIRSTWYRITILEDNSILYKNEDDFKIYSVSDDGKRFIEKH